MTGSEEVSSGPVDWWRLDEWHALPDGVCFIQGCTATETDQRGPIFLRDDSMHKACPEHWEPIIRVLGEQRQWERDAMRSSSVAESPINQVHTKGNI